jgi:hypothetical protein
MEQNTQLNGNSIDIEELRIAYNKAVEEKKDSFTYNELPLVTDYVKYLLEYADSQFKKL